jgi:hypothetical protein
MLKVRKILAILNDVQNLLRAEFLSWDAKRRQIYDEHITS